jgi:hypothetical protein
MEPRPLEYDPGYLKVFGLIEVEWNRLENEIFLLFYGISGLRLDKAHAAFFSLQNHRARREMLEAIAVQALYKKPAMLTRFGQLMRRVKNASSKRNEIIHCIWEWNGKPWPLWPVGSPLAKIGDALKEIGTRAQTIRAVRNDLAAFRGHLPSRRPLHDKSRWPVYRDRAS